MKPLGFNVQSEMVSAMSAMNMREDDAERYIYFTDIYDSVKNAHNMCSNNIQSPSEDILLKVIELLKHDDLHKKHFLLNHAIEHIESAIEALNR